MPANSLKALLKQFWYLSSASRSHLIATAKYMPALFLRTSSTLDLIPAHSLKALLKLLLYCVSSSRVHLAATAKCISALIARKSSTLG